MGIWRKYRLMLTLLGVTVISMMIIEILLSGTTHPSANVLRDTGRSLMVFTSFLWTQSERFINNSRKDKETRAETQNNKGHINTLSEVNDTQIITLLKKQRYYSRLRDSEMESVDLHDFKSDYIINPIFYEFGSPQIVPVNSTTKIISCFNCPNYFILKRHKEREKPFFNKCPYNNCLFDAYGKRMKEADVLLILKNPRFMPPRPQGQIWAYCEWEPPTNFEVPGGQQSSSRWKGVFNWTCGYMHHSELYSPYGKLAWRAKETLMSDDYYIQHARRKTKTAVWWVSRCNVPSNRRRYVEEMQKYIDIDIYGKCGTHKCKRDENCALMLNETYKFYLAFENSFCTDYVTEKFFKLFQERIFVVPVVRGGFDYNKNFPPGSFINANDFNSAKELALYLKYLSNNIYEYASFLKDKDRVMKVNVFDINEYCDLCQRLHTGVEYHVIPDLRSVTHAKDLCWKVQDVF